MSMNVEFWVGPIAVCRGIERERFYEVRNQLCDRMVEVRGELWEADCHYWGANQLAPRAFMLSKYDDQVKEFPDIQKELQWFKETFAVEIAHLESMYGTVEIKWGIVSGVS